MKKNLNNILKYVAEVVAATIVWCGLDYFTGEPLNIVENLVSVAVLVLLCNITDYIFKKFQKKK